MSEVVNGNNEWSSGNDRCLFVEEGVDRSVRCGCYKYILVENRNSGFTEREASKAGISIVNDNFYDLCDNYTGTYINAPEVSPESRSTSLNDWLESELMDKLDCHLKRTNPSNGPNYDRSCDSSLPNEVQPDQIVAEEDIQIVAKDDILSSFLNEPTPWSDESDPSRAPTQSPIYRYQ